MVISMVAGHVQNPAIKHQRAAVKVVKYLKATRNHLLNLAPEKGDQLNGFVYSNWAGESGSGRQSRTGFALYYFWAVINHTSSVQKGIALSSTEAEYVALSGGMKMIIWIRQILEELGKKQW